MDLKNIGFSVICALMVDFVVSMDGYEIETWLQGSAVISITHANTTQYLVYYKYDLGKLEPIGKIMSTSDWPDDVDVHDNFGQVHANYVKKLAEDKKADALETGDEISVIRQSVWQMEWTYAMIAGVCIGALGMLGMLTLGAVCRKLSKGEKEIKFEKMNQATDDVVLLM